MSSQVTLLALLHSWTLRTASIWCKLRSWIPTVRRLDRESVDGTEAPREFQEQQTQRLIQSISASEGPSWRDDQQYAQFQQGAPPQRLQGPVGRHAWADEYNAHASSSAAAHMPQGNQWAEGYQASICT